ncbi:MAG: cytochrome P450, partial [Verrucomicrobiota bacterium]
IHRDKRFFTDPLRFIPERFEHDEIDEYAWFPFARGPRRCIGEEFAMFQGVLILAMILRAYKLGLQSGFEPIPQASITLSSSNGMMMTVLRRES